jgi:hypothetical protein
MYVHIDITIQYVKVRTFLIFFIIYSHFINVRFRKIKKLY